MHAIALSMPVFAAQESSNWRLPLIIATIPALASITAAILATRAARASKIAEIEAQHLRDLEGRISEKKYDTYRPMLDTLKDLLNQQVSASDFRERTSEFSTWIAIYGSDEAVKAFHDFMQTAFHDPPPKVLMKLYAEFILAARRDIGNSATQTQASHFLGMRINDIYDNGQFSDIDKPVDVIFADAGWVPPWIRRS